ncbi:MAG: BrnT family toxin [Bacteroidota bacterium]
MTFEYDPEKSHINKQKHGIDFDEAQSLWLDYNRIEIPARTIGEPRRLLIAGLDDGIWSAVFTMREGAIRIISVRRSRKNEEEIYFSERI